METKRKKLNLLDCMGFCVGQIIGSGIMVLTGIVIGLTGHGTPWAFIGAAILAVIITLPSAVLASSISANGAGYTYLRKLIGERTGFFYLSMFVITQVLIATFAKGFASYFATLFPAFSEKWIALIVLALAAGINIVGLKTTAIVQNIMVAGLLLSLFLFAAFGLPNVRWSDLTPTAGNVMPGGLGSFLMGIALLSFATGGAKFIAENGDEIENPGKNIPRAMILSTIIVSVFYALIGIVACGVLPLEKVAYQNLTVVAKEIFPPWLYLFFIVGGAMFALLTTLNGTLSWVTRGLQSSAKKGWLPKIFVRESKGGAPVVLILLFFVVGAVPIVTEMSTEAIAGMGIGLDMLCEFMILVACFRLPSKFPVEFKNAQFTFKPAAFYTLLVVAGVLMLGTSYVSLSDLTRDNYIIIAVYMIIAFLFTQIRFKFMQRKNGPQGVIADKIPGE